MNLGTQVPDYGEAVPATPSKPKTVYPTVTIEKKTGNYKYGDTFTATVKFKVREISEGKAYGGATPTHRCTLEMISMEPVKPARKGFPY